MTATIAQHRSEDLHDHIARLESVNKDLESFVATAAHDLQTPVRQIRNYGELLQNRLTSVGLDEQSLDYLSRMLRLAGRSERLVRDFLAFAHADRPVEARTAVSLNEVVGDVVQELKADFEQVGARVDVADLPIVRGSAWQMKQLFTNLLTNALRYRDPQRPLRVAVVHATRGSRGPRTVCVNDNGLGFEPSDAERIFEPFFRAHPRQAPEGNGIGLAICRRIVERSGGNIWATATRGTGASFWIELPGATSRAASHRGTPC